MIDSILKRVRGSFVARRQTYLTRYKAWFKEFRSNYKNLGQPSYYIWILGCQRSGTTLLERVFSDDLDSAVFGEFSELTIDPLRTVWKPLPAVETILSTCNARYAVARPLFESDRAVEILDSFPNSKVIWLFRDCPHVVSSMINKWGDKFFDISRRTESDKDGFWRLEHLIEGIKSELGCESNIYDQYALYWLKRNEIVFSNKLGGSYRFMCLEYNQFVTNPKYCIDSIMKRCGQPGVWRGFKSDAHTNSMHKQVTVAIAPEILGRCEAIHTQLQELSKQHFPDA